MDLPFVGAKRRSKEEEIFRWLWQKLMLLHQRGHKDADGESEGLLLLWVATEVENTLLKEIPLQPFGRLEISLLLLTVYGWSGGCFWSLISSSSRMHKAWRLDALVLAVAGSAPSSPVLARLWWQGGKYPPESVLASFLSLVSSYPCCPVPILLTGSFSNIPIFSRGILSSQPLWKCSAQNWTHQGQERMERLYLTCCQLSVGLSISAEGRGCAEGFGDWKREWKSALI